MIVIQPNIQALLDAQTAALTAEIDDNATALATETTEIDNKLNSLTSVDGQLDTNVQAINDHTSAVAKSPFVPGALMQTSSSGIQALSLSTANQSLETIYSRSGAGCMWYMWLSRRGAYEIWIDDVKVIDIVCSDTTGSNAIMDAPNSEFRFMAYTKKLEIKARSLSGAGNADVTIYQTLGAAGVQS